MRWWRPGPLVLAALAVLAAVAGRLPAPLAAAALSITFGFTPGWILVRQLEPGARPAWGALLALVLSPLAAGGVAAIAMSLGAAPAPVATASAWAIGLLALVPARTAAPQGARESPAPWVAGAGWAALVVAFLAGNTILLTRADGWFHAAVTLQAAQRGLPVEDPFFAGLRLLYFWGYHVHAALPLAIAPALPVWVPLVASQVAGALATMIGVALLAQRLGASARGQYAAVVLAVVGYLPFGWAWLGVRVWTGDVRGGAEITQLLTRGIAPVLAAMSPGTLHTSMAFFGDKYLIPTPFALGFAMFLAFTLLLLDATARPRFGAWVLLALVQGASLFLHSVVGWSNALMAAGWGAWTLLRALRTRERGLWLAVAGVAAAGLAATLLLLPYIGATSAGKRQVITWGISGPVLRTWLLAGGLYVVPGMIWLARGAGAPGPARELWGLATALTLASLLLGLPLANQSKLFNLLFLLLAAPAALQLVEWCALARGARRATIVAGLALAVVPTVGLAMWGFATEAGQLPYASELPRSDAVRDACAWASRHTPPDAVFVDPEEELGVTVLAGRSVLWGGDRWAGNWGYDERSLERRRRAVEELGAGRPSDDTRALLRELDRPVVLIHRKFRAPTDSVPGAAPGVTPDAGQWTRVYENEGVALYRWKGGP